MVKCSIYETLDKINALLGPIGFVITLVGLGFTALQAFRARRSADIARQETEKAVQKLAKYSVIANVSAAVETIEEIRRYQRYKVWPPLLDRYSALVAVLNKVKADQSILREKERTHIQSTVTYARRFERIIEKALDDESEPRNAHKLNSVMAERIDEISEILGRLEGEYKE